MLQEDLKTGDKVIYVPLHGNSQCGIVSSIPSHTRDSVFVVYNCSGEWGNYQNYSSCLTKLKYLKKEWI